MIEILALFFIFIAALELWIGYKVISKSDPFTAVSLLCIRFIFDFVVRPFTFIFIEGYDPDHSRQVTKGLIHVADAPFYALLTIVLNDIAFLCLLLGAYVYIKNKPIHRISMNTQSNTKYLTIGLLIYLLGFLAWYWVMQNAGGLIAVLVSLGTGRQHLFQMGGSTIPFEIAKIFLTGGTFLMASYFFINKRILVAWLLMISLFVLLLSFGGRGLAVSAIISGLIAHNYLYKTIKLKYLIVLFLISLPLLMFLRDARRLADGETELADIEIRTAFENMQDDVTETLIDLSYVSHAFDYDMAFHYSYFERDKDFFLGEYPLGLGMVLPRTYFPNKGETLAQKLAQEIWCDGIGCKIELGISPSMVTAAAAYWTYFSYPFICFMIGYFAMFFWRYTVVYLNNPLSLMVYSLGYPYTVTLFNDLNAFVAAIFPIAFITIFSYFLIKFPYKVLYKGTEPKIP
jgi:hypothetical protein